MLPFVFIVLPLNLALRLLHRGWALNVDACPPLASILRGAGYQTHLFGFQHEHYDPSRLGYEHQHEGAGEQFSPEPHTSNPMDRTSERGGSSLASRP